MSDAPRQPPPKKEVALALLEESSMFIHLDPRRADVLVPKGFMGQPQLVLQVGLNMAIPIPDLRVDDAGISCTLSFNRSAFWCRIPWSAIYALIDEQGRGGVWAEDVPPEIQQQRPGGGAKAPAKKPRPKLAVAPEPGSQASDGSRASDEPEGAATTGSPELAASPPPSAPPPAAASLGPRRGLRAVPSTGLMGPVETPDDGIVEDEPPPREVPAASVAPISLAPADPDAASADGPPTPSQPPAGGKKPKREIPPYLRRIK